MLCCDQICVIFIYFLLSNENSTDISAPAVKLQEGHLTLYLLDKEKKLIDQLRCGQVSSAGY